MSGFKLFPDEKDGKCGSCERFVLENRIETKHIEKLESKIDQLESEHKLLKEALREAVEAIEETRLEINGNFDPIDKFLESEQYKKVKESL